MPSPRTATYRAAVLEALLGEMQRDDSVIVMGEDIGAAGGVFKQTEGLFAQFGGQRVIDTPISEAGAFGIAVGAAMTGQRPVFEVMFGDFITLVMDQLVNQAAKISYMSAGQFHVPLVLRTAVGIGGNLGPQHSQSLHAWAVHIPGLKVVMPSTPADAKGLMAAAIRDDGPVIFFEDRMLYNMRDAVPEGDYVVPIGSADIKRTGRDLTMIATGRMAHVALAAAELLAKDDISAEVIDPRSLVPLDLDTLVASVKRTSRAIVADGGYRQYGVTGEIAAIVTEHAFDWLDAPVLRIGAADVPIPFSKSLEPLVLPDARRLAREAAALVRGFR
ncbi:MAG TPA: alpha-ketoacid dehydrogenase subunit beta [Xanthobacteraceae bacterium]|nr:alpha-ketoacid dehydrogenase subunit beta [Xanthobacteraceae bacterium]